MIETTQKLDNWSDEFFTSLYWRLFMQRTATACNYQVAHLLTLIDKHLPCNQKYPNKVAILDTCAGISDIAYTLAHQLENRNISYSLETVEMIKEYCTIAKDQNIPEVKIVCANIFDYFKHNSTQFDIITNWYSSFGLFTHEKNQDFLSSVITSLAPKGIFILETLNPQQVKNNFRPQMTYELNDEVTRDCFEVQRNCNLLSTSIEYQSEYSNKSIYTDYSIMDQTWVYKNLTTQQLYSYETASCLYEPVQIFNFLKSTDSEIEVSIYSSETSHLKEANIIFSKRIDLTPGVDESKPRLIYVVKKK